MTAIERANRVIMAFIVCMDIILINLLFVFLHFVGGRYFATPVCDNLLLILLSLTISYIISSFFSGVILYYRRVRTDQIVRKTISAMILFVMVWLFVASMMNIGVTLNSFTVIFILLLIAIATVMRLMCHSLLRIQRKRGKNTCNVVYVGSGSNLIELYDEMALQLTTGYNVLGYFSENSNAAFDDRCPYLGCANQVSEYLSANDVHSVYCGLPSRDHEVILPIINHCEGNLIRFFSVPNFRNYCQRRVSLEMFSNVPLLTIREEPLNHILNRVVKRLFDVIFSLCFLCTAFLPIYIIVGIITKITSPGPVFFKQKRHGIDGKEFYMYKFRSMKVNKDSDTLQATKDDPRKTKFGDLLRRTSIDELPQFINVLMGDMSIVGPRPHMVKHTEEYSQLIKTYMVRHFIKPGVTGWAQVTGFRGETKELSEMEGRVKADIWYMEHWTFMLDLYVIYKTVANVAGGKDKKAF